MVADAEPKMLKAYQKDGIGWIVLNTPANYNAFNQYSYLEVTQALNRHAADDKVVITVLTGTGKFFSSGADVTESKVPPEDPTEASLHFRMVLELGPAQTTRAIIKHPKVLVVALNGPVVGYPAAAISHADLIYAAESAYIYAPFSLLGVNAEGGSSVGFVQRMGRGPAMEALLMGRRFTARELFGFGFVNQVFPDATFHKELETYLLGLIENLNPASWKATKDLVNAAYIPAATLALTMETESLNERFMSGDPGRAFFKLMSNIKSKKSKL